MAKVRIKNTKASEAAAKVDDAVKKGTKAGKRKLKSADQKAKEKAQRLEFAAKRKEELAKQKEIPKETPEEKAARIAIAREKGASKYGHAKLGATLGDLIAFQRFGSYPTKTHKTKEELQKINEK